MELKKTYKVIFGVIQILLSLFWIFYLIELYNDYQNPALLYAFRLPNWVLLFELVLSLINIILGLNLVLKKINIKKSYGYFILIVFVSFLVENFYYLF